MTTVTGMNNLPFGFGAGSSGDPSDPNDFAAQMPLFAELQKLLSWSGGPVNWDLAKQLATSTLAGSGSSTVVSPAERKGVADALRLADLWLDDATDFPSGVRSIESWTRAEWLERTLPVWSALCEPVASRVVAAMSDAIPKEQLEALGAGNPLAGIMQQVGGLMFGAQVGQGLGGLALEVLSAADIGIPLGPEGTAALVAQNVTGFGQGLERPADEVRLYLALREAAHQRLFTHVPWLRQKLLDTVDAYSRGISIDMSAIEEAMSGIDPMNPQGIQDAIGGGLFAPQQTPQQEVALRRLETLLALVEGWVDTVVTAAAGDRMPGAEALREASRRRRASGGPAEQTFATLVGLELRPRRLRDAAALWWNVTDKRGVSARDATWSHPDLLPTADDLDNPFDFVERDDERGRLRGARRPQRAARRRRGRARRRVGSLVALLGVSALGRRRSSVIGVVGRRCRRWSVSSVHRVVDEVVGERQVRGRADAVEVAAGPLGARVARDELPEPRPVARLDQMRELVQEHVVLHPGRHLEQPTGEPDRAVRWGAGGPAGAHRRDPAHAVRPGPSAEVTLGELRCAPGQRVVAGAPAVARRTDHAIDHPRDPLTLLGGGEAGRDEHDDALAVAVGGHRAPAAGATADLDGRAHGSGPRSATARCRLRSAVVSVCRGATCPRAHRSQLSPDQARSHAVHIVVHRCGCSLQGYLSVTECYHVVKSVRHAGWASVDESHIDRGRACGQPRALSVTDGSLTG